nr:MAG TPA: hypothetical protein [Caudoviricetes sp.]DAZ56982.1 MAG TPA: hypothetical protein [Caudoviricetes sp.]
MKITQVNSFVVSAFVSLLYRDYRFTRYLRQNYKFNH